MLRDSGCDLELVGETLAADRDEDAEDEEILWTTEVARVALISRWRELGGNYWKACYSSLPFLGFNSNKFVFLLQMFHTHNLLTLSSFQAFIGFNYLISIWMITPAKHSVTNSQIPSIIY